MNTFPTPIKIKSFEYTHFSGFSIDYTVVLCKDENDNKISATYFKQDNLIENWSDVPVAIQDAICSWMEEYCNSNNYVLYSF